LDHEPSACARTSSSRAFLRRPEPRVLWPVADAMRGRKVDMHFARAAKMSRSSRLVDAPPMLVPSADQHRVPQHVDHVPLATDPRATGGWQAAVRHDTVVSRRRRRHATAASRDFLCVPFGGVSQRARLYNSDALCDDGGPGAKYADCTYGSDCADCGPRVPRRRRRERRRERRRWCERRRGCERHHRRERRRGRLNRHVRGGGRGRHHRCERRRGRCHWRFIGASAGACGTSAGLNCIAALGTQRLCVRPRKQLTD
jgi:hypothetical protein